MEIAPLVLASLGVTALKIAPLVMASLKIFAWRENACGEIYVSASPADCACCFAEPRVDGRAFCHSGSMEILQKCSILTEALIRNRRSCKYTSISADTGLYWNKRDKFLHFCSNILNFSL